MILKATKDYGGASTGQKSHLMTWMNTFIRWFGLGALLVVLLYQEAHSLPPEELNLATYENALSKTSSAPIALGWKNTNQCFLKKSARFKSWKNLSPAWCEILTPNSIFSIDGETGN